MMQVLGNPAGVGIEYSINRRWRNKLLTIGYTKKIASR